MNFREELKWVVPLVVVCFLVFANTLSGDFVYDDLRQILRNPLIQDNALIWKALTSDVWAFKGDGSLVASNYWRPTFTLFHIVNFRLFGSDPQGWHAANIALHTLVCSLAFGLLRRSGVKAAIAFTTVLIFAVHPVHVESVAWISGSPDLLFAAAFLGSLWFASSFSSNGRRVFLIAALLLYAVALGAKEIGVLCLPLYYLVLSKESETRSDKRPLIAFGAIAAAYFVLRWIVLGALSRPPEDAVGFSSAILSVPSIFVFYLRQVFFPYWLGANYPLEPVSTIGAQEFLLPLAIAAVVLVAILFLAKRSRVGQFAAALFLLPLIPAMNATAFIPDQIVHDRYLYLPLLGIVLLVLIPVAKYVEDQNLVLAGIAVAAILSIQTVAYNRVWNNEFALWSWTAAIDDSSFTSMQYGSTLAETGRNEEAIAAFTRSIEKRPSPRAHLARGRTLAVTGRPDEAERDLLSVVGLPDDRVEAYALYQAYEALGIVYSGQGDQAAAEKTFRDARNRLPIYGASLTVNLATVLYQSGRKDEALRELESAKQQARVELLPEAKTLFLRLGQLNAELGRSEEARAALREYLSLTASNQDRAIENDRLQAAKLLEKLR